MSGLDCHLNLKQRGSHHKFYSPEYHHQQYPCFQRHSAAMLMVFTFLHNKLIISPPLPVSELASKHSAPSLSIPASKRSILEKAHKTFPIATAHYKKKVSALRTLLVMLFPRYFTMPASRKLLNQTCFHNSINNKLFLLVSTA